MTAGSNAHRTDQSSIADCLRPTSYSQLATPHERFNFTTKNDWGTLAILFKSALRKRVVSSLLPNCSRVSTNYSNPISASSIGKFLASAAFKRDVAQVARFDPSTIRSAAEIRVDADTATHDTDGDYFARRGTVADPRGDFASRCPAA